MTLSISDTRLRASQAPIGVVIEPTSLCNLKCIFCPLTVGASSTATAVSYLDVDRMAPQLWAMAAAGMDQVVLAGFGEPSLHPRFIELLKLIDASGMLLSYSTNGITLPLRIIEALPGLEKLVTINISIDVGSSVEYARIRGGNLEKVWRNVTALSQMGRFSVNVSAIMTKSNAPHLCNLVSSAHKSGARFMTFQSLYDTSEELRSEHILSDSSASELIDLAEAQAAAIGLQVTTAVPERRRLERDDPEAVVSEYFEDPRPQGLSRNCQVPWEWPFVDAKGQVFPCCNTAAVNTAKIGDLGTESLSDIWNGKKMRRFRQALASAATCPDVCANCSVAPAGFPAAITFAASLVGKPSVREGRVTVRFRNIGTASWEGSRRPCIGTAGPRDRVSDAASARWLSANRAAMMNEEAVAPGEIATFEFDLEKSSCNQPESFALVIDGMLWLPRTFFNVGKAASKRLGRTRDIFAARLIGTPVIENGRIKVRYRNAGMAPWAGKYRPCIGSSGPRDRISGVATSGWISGNRPVSMNEARVEPGEIATFEFEVEPFAADQDEAFELVIEGVLWIPRTGFSIAGTPRKPRPAWRSLVASIAGKELLSSKL